LKSESEDDDPSDDIEEDLDPEDFDEPVAQQNLPPAAAEYLKWLRRQIIHIEAIKIICGTGRRLALAKEAPSLLIKLASIPHPGTSMQPWKDVITDIWRRQDPQDPPGMTAETVIQSVIDARIFKADKSLESSFRGNLHCEACLAALLCYGDGTLADGGLNVRGRMTLTGAY